MEEGALQMEEVCLQSIRTGDERGSLDAGGKEQRSGFFPELPRRNQHFHLNPVKHTADFLLPDSQKIQLSYFKSPNVFLI